MDLLGIGPIIQAATEVIGRFIPDPNKKAEVELELTKALLSNQQSIYDAMKTVMAADAASESWLTRNARPIVVMWGLTTITWIVLTAFIDAIFDTHVLSPTLNSISAVPDQLWNIVMVGIGGYILAKGVTDGIAAARKK